MKEENPTKKAGDSAVESRIESGRKGSGSKWTGKLFVASLAVFSVCFALLCAALVYVNSKDVVPASIFQKVLIGAVVFIVAEILLLLGSRRKIAFSVISIVLCVVVIAASSLGIYTVYKVYEGIRNMEDEGSFFAYLGVYVRRDSRFAPENSEGIINIKETQAGSFDGARLGVMILNLDRGYGSQATRIFRKTYKDVSVSVYEDFGSMIDALRNGEVDAVLFNEAFIGIYFDEESDFEQWAVLADRIGIETEHTAVVNKADVVSEPFIIYISGIDCNQDIIYDSNLSDVNLTVLVDPVKKKVLIVNTPRDYYVPLWGKS